MITTITILDKIYQFRPEFTFRTKWELRWFYNRLSLIWKDYINYLDYPGIKSGELFYVKINCSNGDIIEVGVSRQGKSLSKEYLLFVDKLGNSIISTNINCIYVDYDFFLNNYLGGYKYDYIYFNYKYSRLRAFDYEDGVIDYINNKILRGYKSNIRLISSRLIIIDELFVTELNQTLLRLWIFVRYFWLCYYIIADTKPNNILVIDLDIELFLGRQLTLFILNEAEKDNINLVYPLDYR